MVHFEKPPSSAARSAPNLGQPWDGGAASLCEAREARWSPEAVARLGTQRAQRCESRPCGHDVRSFGGNNHEKQIGAETTHSRCFSKHSAQEFLTSSLFDVCCEQDLTMSGADNDAEAASDTDDQYQYRPAPAFHEDFDFAK